MVNFFQTMLGKIFFEHHVPEAVRQLVQLNENIERSNQLKEKELELKERELALKEKINS